VSTESTLTIEISPADLTVAVQYILPGEEIVVGEQEGADIKAAINSGRNLARLFVAVAQRADVLIRMKQLENVAYYAPLIQSGALGLSLGDLQDHAIHATLQAVSQKALACVVSVHPLVDMPVHIARLACIMDFKRARKLVLGIPPFPDGGQGRVFVRSPATGSSSIAFSVKTFTECIAVGRLASSDINNPALLEQAKLFLRQSIAMSSFLSSCFAMSNSSSSSSILVTDADVREIAVALEGAISGTLICHVNAKNISFSLSVIPISELKDASSALLFDVKVTCDDAVDMPAGLEESALRVLTDSNSLPAAIHFCSCVMQKSKPGSKKRKL